MPSSSTNLTGKVAVVTGATSGIGLGLARNLVKHGAKVAFVGRRADKGKAVQDELGPNALFVQADVANDDDVKKVFNETVAKFGRVDLVFNNAAIEGSTGNVQAASLSDFDNVFNVNVKGPLRVIQQALPILEKNGNEGGIIVNTSSVLSMLAAPGYSTYAASKAALDAYSRILAEEVKEKNIKVFSINPFVFTSEMTERLVGGDEGIAQMANMFNPSKVPGTPDQFGEYVVKIVQGETPFLPGETIAFDGTNALNLLDIVHKTQ
eukprot:m.52929 g.52929  ORF g.52929 m.52929 type:complete len:265 (-) comp10829_c0_seq1:2116-2910(-)